MVVTNDSAPSYIQPYLRKFLATEGDEGGKEPEFGGYAGLGQRLPPPQRALKADDSDAKKAKSSQETLGEARGGTGTGLGKAKAREELTRRKAARAAWVAENPEAAEAEVEAAAAKVAAAEARAASRTKETDAYRRRRKKAKEMQGEKGPPPIMEL
jgi:hypothetical protein